MDTHEMQKWIVPGLRKSYYKEQIEEFILAKILRYGILAGDELPSSRQMAKLNGIHRNTVFEVYRRLNLNGWLVTASGGKTYVTEHPPIPMPNVGSTTAQLPAEMRPGPETLSVTMPETIRDYVSIGPQHLNESFMPYKLLEKYSKAYIRSRAGSAQADLLADDRIDPLLLPMAGYLNCRGFSVSERQLHLIRGKAAALNRLFQLLVPDDGVLINTVLGDETTEYVLRDRGIKYLDLDSTAVSFLDDVGAIVQKHNVKAVYLRPSCSYLKSHTMNESTCDQLIAMAIRHHFYLIEDDDEHEFWFGKEPFKSLVRYPNSGHVVYCGALSKLSGYMENLRVIVAAPEIMSILKMIPAAPWEYRDRAIESAIVRMLNTGELQSLARKARAWKQKDYISLHHILQTQLKEYLRYQLPEHGFSLWITFDERINLKSVLDKIEQFGIRVPYFPEKQVHGNHIRCMRLDISQYDEQECLQAAVQLRNVFKRLLR